MESDPYLALAADSRKYGSVHTRRHRGNVQATGLHFFSRFRFSIDEILKFVVKA